MIKKKRNNKKKTKKKNNQTKNKQTNTNPDLFGTLHVQNILERMAFRLLPCSSGMVLESYLP